MSLNLLLSTIQSAGVGNVGNTLLMIVQSVIEKFTAVEDNRAQEIATLREMIANLEERNLQAIEAYRAEVRREMDVVAESVEKTRRHILDSLGASN